MNKQDKNGCKKDMEIYIFNLMNKKETKLLFNDTSNTIPIPIPIKSSDQTILIPPYKNYHYLLEYNYNVLQLKHIAKFYKIKISGKKTDLLQRIFAFLYLSFYIIKIQKLTRGNLWRKYYYYKGPAYIKRKLCNNNNDFLTYDDVKEISNDQFFSYKDKDGFIYGFDLLSISNLINKAESEIQNPYNRYIIPGDIIQNFKKLLKISKLLKIPTNIEIINNHQIPINDNIHLRCTRLFQNIDLLGNYTEPSWFLNLNRSQIIRFLRELVDIWTFRLQLTIETKIAICPPLGNPFIYVNNIFINNNDPIDFIKNNVLGILEKLVNTGINRDYKSLGAYYVLGALTLVSSEAAFSLPWLYQSVCYN